MKVKLFGTVQALGDNGAPVKFATSKERGMFMYLAMRGNQAIPRAELATLLWGNSSDKIAKHNLRNALVRLKKRVVAATDNSPLVVTRKTITFDLSAVDRVDALMFDQLWARCQGVDPASWVERGQSVQLLTQAVALYQGPFTHLLTIDDAIEFEVWQTELRETYHQRVMIALTTIAEFHVNQQNWIEAERFARQQIALEVWHEPAYRQLMRIYSGMGQLDAALAQYEQCRRVLLDELGIEPSKVTQALHASLKPHLVPTIQTTKPTLVSSPHNLPPDDTPFLGRIAELEKLQNLLAERTYRLISLVGYGGVGKTRLSLALARSQLPYFARGVYFVSLVGVQSADGLPIAIADALGLTFAGSKSPQAQLNAYLRDREMLIILDNMEHLLSQDAAVASIVELYRAAQACVFVITSRQRLFLRAETVFMVQGLSYPESADSPLIDYEAPQLFIERLRRVKFGYQPDADQTAIIQICRLVDGLPLALELAATQSGLSSCSAVLKALITKMDTLQTQLRDIPARQRSLRAVFDYSWQLLTPIQQTILTKLSIFRDGFDSVAIATIVPDATMGLLAELEGYSLLRHHSETGRYDLHEMVRTFAASHLADKAAESRAHADYFLDRLVQMEAALEGEQPHIAARALLPDLNNIQQAWRFNVEIGRFSSIASAVNPLSVFLQVRGLFYAGRTLWRETIACARRLSAEQTLLSKLLSETARFHLRLSEFDAAVELTTEACAVADNLWDRGNATNVWAEALWRKGDSHLVTAPLEQLLQELKTSPSAKRILGSTYYNLAVSHVMLQNYHLAQDNFEAALQLWQALGHKRFEAITINGLGVVAERRQEYTEAERQYLRTIALHKALDNERELAQANMNLGFIKGLQGLPRAGIKRLMDAIAYYRQSGDRATLGLALNNLSYNYHENGNYSAAATCLEEAWELAVATADKILQAYVMHSKARVMASQGKHFEALAYYENVLSHCQSNHISYSSLDMLLNEKSTLTHKMGQRVQPFSISIARATA